MKPTAIPGRNLKIITTEGDIKAGEKVEYDIKEDGYTFEGRDQMAFIEFPSVYVGLDRIVFGDITKGGTYTPDKFKLN